MPLKSYGRKVHNAIGAVGAIGRKMYSAMKKAPRGPSKYRQYGNATKASGGRSSRSITGTLTKPKNRYQRDSAIGEPSLTFSHGRKIHTSQHFIKKVREACSNVNTHLVKNFTTSSSVGNGCSYSYLNMLNDPLDFIKIAVDINSYNTINESTLKYLLRDSKITYQLVNQTNLPMNLRIYECVPRNDVPVMPSIYASVQSILLNSDSDVGDSGLDLDIAGTLFQNTVFCTYFKIIHTRTIIMQPGENKSINIFHNTPSVINMERVRVTGGSDTTNKLMAMRGLSKFCVFQNWGSIVDNGAADTFVGVSASKLDILCQVSYKFQWTPDTLTNVFTTGTYGAVSAPTTINELTGVTTTTTNA